MALLKAAFAAARSSPVRFPAIWRSVQSITALPKRSFSTDSALCQFRRDRGFSVTDFTASEWCEKQKKYRLSVKLEATEAMIAGTKRHAQLENEVNQNLKVCVRKEEDKWALKFLKFITGVSRLTSDGLTRELPLVGLVEGVGIVGVVDEIRMGSETSPVLLELKTRESNCLPSSPQKRNGRMQLMCYKLMWDNLAAGDFPVGQFLDYYSLDSHCVISDDIRQEYANSGYHVETLGDSIRYFQNTSRVLPSADEQLVVRYEWQKDQSLIDEDHFTHDPDWIEGKIQSCLEFLRGEREAKSPPKEELWKCKHCDVASICPVNNPNLNLEESKLLA